MLYKVKDVSLADKGKLKIEWAESRMPVLMLLRKEYEKTKPLKGTRIAACLHVTKETAVLVKTLKMAGAEVWLCGSNPLSTQDDVAAALAKDGIHVFAWRGQTNKEYYWCIEQTLMSKPDITMDDGADLINTIHSKKTELIKNLLGGTEETTTGVIRLRAMANAKALKYPIIAVNDAKSKNMFDNFYGTGTSSLYGIARATNILIPGKNVVVVGYGHCGKGVAKMSKGLGAHTIICDVDPVSALQAHYDGHKVMSMDEAAKIGDVFITVTGCKDVIRKEHFMKMKDGAIVCNAGHFNVEVNIEDLKDTSKSNRKMSDHMEEFTLPNNNRIFLLGEGRLVNLACAEGHPSEVMDQSFSLQVLSVVFIKNNKLTSDVYDVPEELDMKVARMKLKTLDINIDELTPEQKEYLTSWESGT